VTSGFTDLTAMGMLRDASVAFGRRSERWSTPHDHFQGEHF
jgi:hypothetical protein